MGQPCEGHGGRGRGSVGSVGRSIDRVPWKGPTGRRGPSALGRLHAMK